MADAEPATAPSRANTHRTPPPRFAGPESFRTFNSAYEAWLKSAYDPDVRPFAVGASHLFLPYLSDEASKRRTTLEQQTTKLVYTITQWQSDLDRMRVVLPFWQQMSSLEREDLLLKLWEKECQDAEAAGEPWAREETPELILEAFSDDPDFLQELMFGQILTSSLRKPFRRIPHDHWDRLNGATPSALPPQASVAAFTAEGLATRHRYLASFTWSIFAELESRVMEMGGTFFGDDPAAKISMPALAMREHLLHRPRVFWALPAFHSSDSWDHRNPLTKNVVGGWTLQKHPPLSKSLLRMLGGDPFITRLHNDQISWMLDIKTKYLDALVQTAERDLPTKEGQEWTEYRRALQMMRGDMDPSGSSRPSSSSAAQSPPSAPTVTPEEARAAKNRKKKERKLANKAKKAAEGEGGAEGQGDAPDP
ncbi:hypothetical protein JCM10207_003670 [Rhodosporidiobolus poonsookiae]